MFDANLIFDLGMHEGEDADFYLKKGFRVIGVEAIPLLSDRCAQRFREACQSGQLIIVNKAIAETAGTIDFYVNDKVSVWGTADRGWMLRNQKVGATSHVIRVPSVRTDDLLGEYGIPYYMKIDIEGFDYLCVSALVNRVDKPKYVSVETHAWSYGETLKILNLLRAAGYNKFNIVSQAGVYKQACPNPPREGEYLDHRFPEQASGLFGRELPGQWLSAGETESQLRRIYRHVRMIGPHNGVFRNIKNRHAVAFLARLFPAGRDWFDIHAMS
jgi:FkbM family methyltransferase